MSTEDLTDLRKITEAATPGPWVYGDNRDGLGNKLHPAKFPGKYNPIADFEYTEDEDAEHIATFDPPTVLGLLIRLEQAEAAVARVREAVKDAPTEDPTRGFAGPPDDYPDIGDFIGNGEWTVADRVRRALDGEQA